jgi:hypothetical protein
MECTVPGGATPRADNATLDAVTDIRAGPRRLRVGALRYLQNLFDLQFRNFRSGIEADQKSSSLGDGGDHFNGRGSGLALLRVPRNVRCRPQSTEFPGGKINLLLF